MERALAVLYWTFSFILSHSFSHWPTFNCAFFHKKISFCKASSRAIISYFLFWGLCQHWVFSLSCCIITRETSLSPLGSLFLHVLLIYSELQPKQRRLFPRRSAVSSCRSVRLSWFRRCPAPLERFSYYIEKKLFYQHFLTIITVWYFFCLPHFPESVC